MINAINYYYNYIFENILFQVNVLPPQHQITIYNRYTFMGHKITHLTAEQQKMQLKQSPKTRGNCLKVLNHVNTFGYCSRRHTKSTLFVPAHKVAAVIYEKEKPP